MQSYLSYVHLKLIFVIRHVFVQTTQAVYYMKQISLDSVWE